jgi:sucrose phosphorylase
LDLYQVNCTFYDALARQDTAYLMARAIQFFVPGIPQVYYVGLLAGSNDMALLAKTGVGRDINRRYYSPEDVDAALTRPVVQDLLALIRLRNTPAAIAGQFAYAAEGTSRLTLTWTNGDAVAELALDLAATTYTLRHTAGSTWETFLPLSANPKTARQSA